MEEDTLDNFCNMTKDEIAQHLQLCMKLAAENKINSKNAFGLHLIQLMQCAGKTDVSDLQQASLSLQAGSKIYSSRVEALYQDTFKFHSHLQSVVAGGKKVLEKDDSPENDEMDSAEEATAKKTSNKAKSKSYLTLETSLSTQREDMTSTSGEPHGNFEVINAIFSTARTAPRLLESCIGCDAFTLSCAHPQRCYESNIALENSSLSVLQRVKGILDKIKKFAVSQEELEAIVSTTNTFLTPCVSTPKPPMVQSFEMFDSDGGSPLMVDHNEDIPALNTVTQRLSFLDITANIFVNEIFDAVKSGKKGETIDHDLLPPNSALKKVITASGRPTIRKPETKKRIIKKKEKFFGEQSVDGVIDMFAPGRSCILTDKALKNFKAEVTTDLGAGYFEFPLLADNERSTKERIRRTENITGVYNSNGTHYFSKQCFLKRNQVLRAFSGKDRSQSGAMLSSSFINNTEMPVGGRPSSMNAEDLAYSLQNLSLNELDEAADDNVCELNSMLDVLPPALEEPDVNSFEFDMDELMVKPPELVKPANVKYEKTPVNFNTEEVKALMWGVISKSLSEIMEQNCIFFSNVYKELKRKLETESSRCISKQYAFVILLILANEKCLCLENMSESPDISIKLDA